MQLNVGKKLAANHDGQCEKCFSKRWGLFYVFAGLTTSSIIFLCFLFFRTFPNDMVLSAILFVCLMAIFLAVFLQIKAIFAVEIFEWGVSKRQLGALTKIYWDEINIATYGAAITLNAGKKKVVVNPLIFKNSREVFVFIEKKLAHSRTSKTVSVTNLI